MKKMISLSLLTISALYAAEIELAPIGVEATVMTDVAQKAQTSADVAQALSDAIPSIDMSRRSGIANDVLIRGQKRDNISVEVDGTKVCGACPNRMDPPVSHIVANQIQTIEVIEGPYDVETFGTLSGGIKITTKKPTAEEQGEINLGFGSFGYKKFGASASGGTDRIRVSATVSTESSDQYRDGDGNTLADQIANNAASVKASGLDPASTPYKKAIGSQLQPQYYDIPAYSKKSAMAKAYIKTFEDQELRLSVTANRSSDILYANTPMDAAYDDSNIYSVEYNIDNVSDVYKNINLQYYHSDVDHPMNTKFRLSGIAKYKTNQLQTAMDGIKLKNKFNVNTYELTIGLDASQRMWQGENFDTNSTTGITSNFNVSLTHTETTNQAIFATLDKSYGALDLEFGARYDSTTVKPDGNYQSNDYSAFSANLMSTYNLNKENKIFLGVGQASRVPDARELYITTTNQDLKQVTNQEIDLGYEINNASFKFKAKAFYSMLQDYIYYNKSAATFENLNAVVYGGELSASVYATDDISVDMGASYKRGTRDTLTGGLTGTNMADMAPLRGNIAANYEYMPNSTATLEVVASDKWSEIDAENGEQELAAWSILNAKVKHAVNKSFDFTLGVNNIFDATYAQSNTYADLVLLSAGTSDIMLLNEPGRYVYTNLDFKF